MAQELKNRCDAALWFDSEASLACFADRLRGGSRRQGAGLTTRTGSIAGRSVVAFTLSETNALDEGAWENAIGAVLTTHRPHALAMAGLASDDWPRAARRLCERLGVAPEVTLAGDAPPEGDSAAAAWESSWAESSGPRRAGMLLGSLWRRRDTLKGVAKRKADRFKRRERLALEAVAWVESLEPPAG
ncbi:hypothetical protein Mal64_33000 [Pseudobythopirellula maris]|uniref:Uncharacterized protein n=1 Tax=Pseudobythopirellula maris TaxID=2527991 RepID=A0A5C5ZH88_9BACT|nr:hypothetical protein [Pseudobythopirellula maris]TWT86475.1 hypothetical protein Mal64_33000 [Pseudobythopirellula maris]